MALYRNTPAAKALSKVQESIQHYSKIWLALAAKAAEFKVQLL
ncbi:hypothetical protein [Acinetobacter sp.]|nr:hypothetical protein [Acinetobacter sp.]